MEVAPPARIPANTVVARLSSNRYAHVLSGKTARAHLLMVLLYEKLH
jgi:hypothetical protein